MAAGSAGFANVARFGDRASPPGTPVHALVHVKIEAATRLGTVPGPRKAVEAQQVLKHEQKRGDESQNGNHEKDRLDRLVAPIEGQINGVALGGNGSFVVGCRVAAIVHSSSCMDDSPEAVDGVHHQHNKIVLDANGNSVEHHAIDPNRD